jgi:hypothetical protein
MKVAYGQTQASIGFEPVNQKIPSEDMTTTQQMKTFLDNQTIVDENHGTGKQRETRILKEAQKLIQYTTGSL